MSNEELDILRGDAIRKKVKAEREIQISLKAFSKEFWPYVVPAPFQDTWVIGALCEHLQALYENQIRRLLINIYMRSGKSTISSAMYPAWVWGQNPSERFLYVASTQSLALRDADYTRDLIKSPKYQAMYRGYSLTKDASGLYRNDKLGSRQSLGAESQVTGFGANNKFFDDPNDANQVESPNRRQSTNDKFGNLSTRSDSFESDRFCVIQQRTHPKDVSGFIDEIGLPFEKLIIPLEYDGRKIVTSIGWSDPRTEKGEVADPSRFPPEAVTELKILLGYRFPGQANQNPATPEGSAVQRSWYPQIDVFNFEDVESIALSYDVGFSSNPAADWTWGSLKAQMRKGNLLEIDELTLWQHFGKWDSPDRDRECSQFGLRVKALIDSGIFPNLKKWSVTAEAGIGGSVEVVRDFIKALLRAGLPASSSHSNVNKVVRSNGYVSLAQAKRVGLCRGNQLPGFANGNVLWIKPFFDIVCLLMYDNAPDGTPRFVGEHDDPIDAEVMAHDALTAPKRTAAGYSPVVMRVKA